MTQQQGLASALLAAQQALPSVGKDSQFKSQSYGYAYTSSETMIAACREVLHAAGLTLRRAGWQFDGTPEGGGLVKSQFILTHAPTGESVADEVAWVAVPRGQQPIDKAVAGALTASLGYYLRDLLLVPREDENEMDKRDDSTYQPRKAPAPAPRPAPAQARTTRSDYATPNQTDGGNAPPRQTQQDAPRAVPAPKAAPTPPKATESTTEAPSGPMREVIGSRPPAAAAWRSETLRILKAVKSDKPTKNGSTRWAILFQTSGEDTWASTFDGDVADAASEARDAAVMVEALVADGQYGWTLYGLRWPEVGSAAPAPQPVEVAEEHIPF
jgi:hypothetical protein